MKRLILVIVAVVCVAAIGIVALQDRTSTETTDHGLVFPGLVDRINEVSEVIVRSNQGEFSIQHRNGIWGVSRFGFYPANPATVRRFLVGMSQLRKLEPKTSDPQRHTVLGLAGLESDDSDSPTTLVLLRNNRGESLSELYFGNSRVSRKNPQLNEYYVRGPSDNQTWLTEGSLALQTQPMDWIDSEIIDLGTERVREVIVRSGGDNRIRVFRRSANDGDFLLDGVSASHQIRHQFAVNDIGEVWRRLNFIDVKPVEGWVGGDTLIKTLTFDGLELEAQIGGGGFDGYVQFSASAGDASDQTISDEAKTLNEKFDNWVYKLSDTRMEIIDSRFDDLIEPRSTN